MSRARSITILAVVAVIVATAFVITRKLSVARRIRSGIGMVQPGMTESDVVALLGRPTYLQKPCFGPRPSCEEDLVYAIPFDFLNEWTISVDHSGRVTAKFYWHSS